MNNLVKDETINRAYLEALKVLKKCSHPLGLKASAKSRGYPQVWARDSMITLLGAILIKNSAIRDALQSSIITLRKNQTDLGVIPNSVDVNTKKACFQAYADGGSWFVIGNAVFFQATKNKSFLKKNYPAIKKVLFWYEHQDGDQSGLLSMSEAADWQDLVAVRDKGLYLNVLYCEALMKATGIAKALRDTKYQKLCLKKARKLRSKINERFWYFKGKNTYKIIEDYFGTEHIAKKKKDALGRKRIAPPKLILKNDSHYIPYITFRHFGEWFDSFGNILTILTEVADKKQSEQILKFIKKHKLITPYPIKAIHPPIFPNQQDWRYYYKFGNLNLPYQYHNGGIWPFLGGFYVAALVKMKKINEAREILVDLALANKKGLRENWEFNEWLHGKKGKPMGMAGQAWSAGMYIYAYECVKKKKAVFF